MNRRQFVQGAFFAAGTALAARDALRADCCQAAAQPAPAAPGRLKITDVKPIGVTWDPKSDRPYVFVKIETDQGVVGWGEATLEGKAAAVIATVKDLHELLIGRDPMKVEHLWQSMYVHSFYRAGPILGSAISGIDQALWDIRGKVLGQPVYRLLGGPFNSRGVRGYYHARATTLAELKELRGQAKELGITAFKSGIPGAYEWLERHQVIKRAVDHISRLREGLGDEIDIGVDFHAKTSPSVASIICKEVEPLNLLFIEEPCPPENVAAMARIARRTTVPIATGERLVASYSCQQLVEQGVVDIIQVDINHVGGITALWKVAAMAEHAGILIAPHACEGPIGGIATLHVDAAIANFLVQEVCSGAVPTTKEKIWEEWLGFPAMRMVDGHFPLPDRPGLGITVSEKALAKYPFQGTRAMPQLYHEDGSVAAW
jgi:galactonate dehydratase